MEKISGQVAAKWKSLAAKDHVIILIIWTFDHMIIRSCDHIDHLIIWSYWSYDHMIMWSYWSYDLIILIIWSYDHIDHMMLIVLKSGLPAGTATLSTERDPLYSVKSVNKRAPLGGQCLALTCWSRHKDSTIIVVPMKPSTDNCSKRRSEQHNNCRSLFAFRQEKLQASMTSRSLCFSPTFKC